MKKLLKKFIILALISTIIGYNATKDKASENSYAEPKEIAKVVEDVESKEVALLSFQLVEENKNMIVQPVDIVVVADSENGETEQLFLTKESEFAENIIGESKEITTDIKDFEEHEDEPVVASTPSTNTTLQPSEIETPEPIVESTPQPTAIPTTTSTPHPMTAPEPTPIPTPEPTPTPTPVQQFDINYWTGFAQNYAQSIGLVLESSAVDCWDNPIPAGYHCKNIEQNITDRLNRYKNLEGFTDVWIWSVETGTNTYDIYIGYA